MTEHEVFVNKIKPYYDYRRYFVWEVDTRRLPDVYVSKGSLVFWLELKVVNKPRRNGDIVPDWRPGQLSWIYAQKNVGKCDNVSLAVWVESTKELRVYRECKRIYRSFDRYEVFGEKNGPF